MTASTLMVTDFILARIAEDEAVAQESALRTPMDVALGWAADRDYLEPYLSVDPARVLAQCAAMREIVGWHQEILTVCQGCATARYPCQTLRALASIWSDHPDWREEWRA